MMWSESIRLRVREGQGETYDNVVLQEEDEKEARNEEQTPYWRVRAEVDPEDPNDAVLGLERVKKAAAMKEKRLPTRGYYAERENIYEISGSRVRYAAGSSRRRF